MGAAFSRVDVVDVREERLAVGIVVLHSDVDDDAVALFAERDGLAVQWRLVLVEALDERGYASLVVELFRALFFLPFVESACIFRPRLRKANSRSRDASVSK